MLNDTLIQSLQENISIMFAFIGRIRNDNVLYRKEKDCLSIFDYILHLSTTQELFYQRLEAFIK